MNKLERVAEKRASVVRERLNIRKNLALAFAYRELGFSKSGISKKVDVTESTSKKYLRELSEINEIPNVDMILPSTAEELDINRSFDEIEVYEE